MLLQGSKNIQIVGMPEVDEIDAAKINSTIEGYYDKLCRIFNNEIMLVVHFKHHSETGIRRKHSVHARVRLPGIIVVASEWDWKLVTSLQKTLAALLREAKSRVQ